MTDKLEALSQPVAYTDREELESMRGPNADTYANLWTIPHGCGQDLALYSQEYVTALREDAARWFNAFEKAVSAGARYEEHIEALQQQAVKDGNRIAELEQRLQQPALADVMAERQRQISAEGWTPDHDDKHDFGEIAAFAVLYAMPTHMRKIFVMGGGTLGEIFLPCGWKPKFSNRRGNLVKAGALILAEIERIDRIQLSN